MGKVLRGVASPELRLSIILRPIMRIIIQVLLLSISLSTASLADDKPDARGSAISAASRSEAAQIAKQRFRGKVLKVQLENGEHPASYKVKLLIEDGTIKVVTIPAENKR